MSKKSVFVSCAWPYANGSLHVGHVSSLLPADVLARFHHLKGDQVLFVSGSDTHGTPISVRAAQEKTTPKKLSQKYHQEFQDNLSQLGFSFERFGVYTHTDTDEHKKVVHEVFGTLYKHGYIEKKTEQAMYDETAKRFLPDRFVEGECPHCHFVDARGDQCDQCGRLLDPTDLLHPVSKISGSTPIQKETEQFYFKLSDSDLQKKLSAYISSISHVRKNTATYTKNFLAGGLHDRAISRDLDWGVSLPKEFGEYPSKCLYVWVEAVTGYLSASKLWAGTSDAWENFWIQKNVQAYYVYGKDNIPFHTVIWPAILLAYSTATKKEFHLPDTHVASEYVQIEGKKLSTSRNWAVWIPDLLEYFSPDAIRYMLLATNPETADTNFSLEDFQAKHNNELLATLGNYVQRVLVLAQKNSLPSLEKHGTLVDPDIYGRIEEKISRAEFKAALQEVIQYAATGNKELDEKAPWKLIKSDAEKSAKVVSESLRRVSQFTILLEPFLPHAASNLRKMLSIDETPVWKPYTGAVHVPKKIESLFTKIEDSDIEILQNKLGNTSKT